VAVNDRCLSRTMKQQKVNGKIHWVEKKIIVIINNTVPNGHSI
jgi:hypothetical protein